MADRLRLCTSLLAGVGAVAVIVAPVATAEPVGGNPYDRVPPIVSGGPVPTMNGVPCVGDHLGTCIGFAQNQPWLNAPRAAVGHSPTVTP